MPLLRQGNNTCNFLFETSSSFSFLFCLIIVPTNPRALRLQLCSYQTTHFTNVQEKLPVKGIRKLCISISYMFTLKEYLLGYTLKTTMKIHKHILSSQRQTYKKTYCRRESVVRKLYFTYTVNYLVLGLLTNKCNQ